MSLLSKKPPTIRRVFGCEERSEHWELIGVHRLPPSSDSRWRERAGTRWVNTAEVLAIAPDAKSLRDAMIDESNDWYDWWQDGFGEYRVVPPGEMRLLTAAITDRTVDLIFDDAWTMFRDHFVSQHDAQTMTPALYRDTHGEDPPAVTGDVFGGITALCEIVALKKPQSERGSDHAG